MSNDNGESDVTPTGSETTCTVGNLSRGSRETPAISVSSMDADRSEKARGHNSEWRKREAQGEVTVIRYADDFVIGFREESDARRCSAALKERFAKLDALREQLRRRRHADLAETGGWLLSVYRGWCQYYAVSGN